MYLIDKLTQFPIFEVIKIINYKFIYSKVGKPKIDREPKYW
jgi:hypothetical protein